MTALDWGRLVVGLLATAIVLVFAASGIRRIALEAKKEARAEDESKD